MIGVSARRRCSANATAATAPPSEVPEAAVGEHLDARVGGGEGQDRRPRGRRRGAGRRSGRPRGRSRPSRAGRRAAGSRSASGPGTGRRRRWRPRRPASASGCRRRTGTKIAPTVRSRSRGGWPEEHQAPAPRVTSSSTAPGQSNRPPGGAAGPARRRTASARTRPTTRFTTKMNRQSATDSTTAPKSGPSTLPISWTAETTPRGTPAALDGVEVGDQGQGRRHQAAAADALEEAPDHHRGHVVGQCGEQRAGGEDDEGGDEDRHPAAQVGDPADERQHRDVPEQEAGDDRCGLLELVDGHADRGHHLRQRQDDDVGVGGGEGDRDGRQRQQRARPSRLVTGPGCPWSCRSRRSRRCRCWLGDPA